MIGRDQGVAKVQARARSGTPCNVLFEACDRVPWHPGQQRKLQVAINQARTCASGPFGDVAMRAAEPLLSPKEFEAVIKLVRMYSDRPRDIARAFYVLGLSRPQIAKAEGCTLPYVRKITERFAEARQRYLEDPGATLPPRDIRKPSVLLTEPQFQATLPYFRTRAMAAVEIAHAFHVKGEAASVIAKRLGCKVQNVAQTLNRFAGAFDRYMAAQRNLGLAPPAPAKRVAATAKAAKASRAKPRNALRAAEPAKRKRS